MKKTTDFGACRDLYGRRLRHVNDEIRLKKWLEDKERESEGRGRCVVCVICWEGKGAFWCMYMDKDAQLYVRTCPMNDRP